MSSARPKLASWPCIPGLPDRRTPLAHLLHALNQPLTGLQCSLELATAGPRPTDYYVRSLREALDLVTRMRVLVEAIRELASVQALNVEDLIPFRLETLLFDAAAELQPVAESKSVRIHVSANCALQVHADRGRMASLFFRLFESAISLSRVQSALQIVAVPEHDTASITLSWTPGDTPAESPFSHSELGLLVAQAAWEQAGGSWTDTRSDERTCVLRIPLTSPLTPSNTNSNGDSK